MLPQWGLKLNFTEISNTDMLIPAETLIISIVVAVLVGFLIGFTVCTVSGSGDK